MSLPRQCPSHPSQPYDKCGICERLIAEREGAELWPPEEEPVGPEHEPVGRLEWLP